MSNTYQAVPYNQIPLSATTLVLVVFVFKPYGEFMKKHTNYLEIPRKDSTVTKIDIILEQRIKEFLLSRRRMRWLELGE